MPQSVVPYEEELWTNGSNLLCRNTQSLKRTCESVKTFGYVLRSMKVWSISFVVLECFIQSQAAVSYAVVFVSDPELPCKVCFQVFDSSTNSPTPSECSGSCGITVLRQQILLCSLQKHFWNRGPCCPGNAQTLPTDGVLFCFLLFAMSKTLSLV